MSKTLWIFSSRDGLAEIPLQDAVLLLGEAAERSPFHTHAAFVDAVEHPSHPFATPLDPAQLIALIFSADKVLHG